MEERKKKDAEGKRGCERKKKEETAEETLPIRMYNTITYRGYNNAAEKEVDYIVRQVCCHD